MAATVALIGAGRRAPWHCAAYVDCDGVTDVLLAEPDDQRRGELVESWGIIRQDHADYRRLLEDETVDVVDVCTPVPARSGIVREALAAKKHVICEGPAAMETATFDGLVSAATRADRKLFVCIPHLMIPANRRVAEFITDEEAGEISLGTVQVTGDEPERAEYRQWPDMDEEASAPILTDTIHDALAVLQWWMGEAVSVSAFAAETRQRQYPDDCSVSFRTRYGSLGQITVSYRAGTEIWREERRIFAANGSLLVRDNPEDELPLTTLLEGMYQSIPVHNPPFIRRHATMKTLWNCIECLDSGQEPQVTLKHASAAVTAMKAAADSLQAGETVGVG